MQCHNGCYDTKADGRTKNSYNISLSGDMQRYSSGLARVGSSSTLRMYSPVLSRSTTFNISLPQFLWHQSKPECRSSTDWIRRYHWHTLGEALQGFDREHYHYCPWFRPWWALFLSCPKPFDDLCLRIFTGYYVSVLTIEKLGRKWIQIQGFLLAALFCSFCFAFSLVGQD